MCIRLLHGFFDRLKKFPVISLQNKEISSKKIYIYISDFKLTNSTKLKTKQTEAQAKMSQC